MTTSTAAESSNHASKSRPVTPDDNHATFPEVNCHESKDDEGYGIFLNQIGAHFSRRNDEDCITELLTDLNTLTTKRLHTHSLNMFKRLEEKDSGVIQEQK